MAKQHIMVVGAHCGDAEVMAGGIVAQYTSRGHRASIVHMTLGEKGHGKKTPERYAAQKREEALAAGDVLGAGVYFLPYKDGELKANDETAYALCDVIRDVKPTVILTHWPESMHKDHTATSHIAEDARYYAALAGFKRERPAHGAWGFLYCENWEDPYDFHPDVYVDISDSFDTYVRALEQYELFRGDASSFRYMDYYKSLAVMRGCLSNCRYAQTLKRPREALAVHHAGIPGFGF